MYRVASILVDGEDCAVFHGIRLIAIGSRVDMGFLANLFFNEFDTLESHTFDVEYEFVWLSMRRCCLQ